MVAPEALVFRPLVKGNEDSGNEIGLGNFILCQGINIDILRENQIKLKYNITEISNIIFFTKK